jgi:hypothetical protein
VADQADAQHHRLWWMASGAGHGGGDGPDDGPVVSTTHLRATSRRSAGPSTHAV